MDNFKEWREQSKKLELYWLSDFLTNNKDFFQWSDFCVVRNIHCSTDEGIGVYLLHKNITEFFTKTDDHNIIYPSMEDCFNVIEQTKDIAILPQYLKSILRPRWQLIIDRVTDKVVGLMGLNEVNLVCGQDNEYSVPFDFEKEYWGHKNTQLYYRDVIKLNYIQGKEYYRARYVHANVTIDKDLIGYFIF